MVDAKNIAPQTLSDDADALLSCLRSHGAKVSIITDGRGRTQRNKLQVWGLEWIEDVVISEELGSEKPPERFHRPQQAGVDYGLPER